MDREKVIKETEDGIAFAESRGFGGLANTMRDALAMLKEQEGVILALEQTNATINYLNEEKENAIKEIEKRKAFNLECDVQPEWLRTGIDVGLNTALSIIKGMEERTE